MPIWQKSITVGRNVVGGAKGVSATNAANALMNLGELAEARVWYKKARDMRPNEPRVQNGIAQLEALIADGRPLSRKEERERVAKLRSSRKEEQQLPPPPPPPVPQPAAAPSPPVTVVVHDGESAGFTCSDNLRVEKVDAGGLAAQSGVKPGMALVAFQGHGVPAAERSWKKMRTRIKLSPKPWSFDFASAEPPARS